MLTDCHDRGCAEQAADCAGESDQSATPHGIVGKAVEREAGGGVADSFGFRLDWGEHVADLVGKKGVLCWCEGMRHDELQRRESAQDP